MRKQVKKKIQDLLETMEELHGLLPNSEENTQKEYLLFAKQGMEMILNTVNKEKGEQKEIQDLGEKYQIELEEYSGTKEADSSCESLNSLVKQLKNAVNAIETSYHVAFFPYNASMWDALETVYFQALVDPSCEVAVVPIPYYKWNESGEKVYCYEGDKLPLYVEVTPYHQYDLATVQPDIAYIHNPFDQYNSATQVDEAYFSMNLKKYVENLVYVPYYIADETVLIEHLSGASAHDQADYFIVQSEVLKEKWEKKGVKAELLALGSPKLDRIFLASQVEAQVPPEWKEKAKGKKVVMLNTTLHSVLTWEDLVFQKLYALFRHLQELDVVILWRPHPLLKATMESMRPELLSFWDRIQDYFLKNDLGIYDESSDITPVVAFCDAYMGCSSSSVVNLFRSVKKPCYFLDYEKELAVNTPRQLEFWNFPNISVKNGRCALLGHQNFTLWDFDTKDGEKHYQGLDWRQKKPLPFPRYFIAKEASLYLPANDEKVSRFSSEDFSEEILFETEKGSKYYCHFALGDLIFYLPSPGEAIGVYDMREKKARSYPLPEKGLYSWRSTCVKENMIYLCSSDVAGIYSFSLDTYEFERILREDKLFLYGYLDGNQLISVEKASFDVYCFDLSTKKLTSFQSKSLQKSLKEKGDSPVIKTAKRLYMLKDGLLHMNFFLGKLLKVNAQGQEEWIELPFLKDNKFNGKNQRVLSGTFRIDQDTLLLQRYWDRKAFKYSVSTGEYEEISMEIPEHLVKKVQDDILKTCAFSADHQYFIHENEFTRPLDFLHWIASEQLHLEESEKTRAEFAAHLGGKSGEMIHKEIMERVKKLS